LDVSAECLIGAAFDEEASVSDGADGGGAGSRSPTRKLAGNKRLTRREFVVVLGTGLAIAGYYLSENKLAFLPGSGGDPANAPAAPRLREDLIFDFKDDFYTVSLDRGDEPLFGVNQVGKSVLGRIDGRNTIEDIAEGLAREFGVGDDDALKANVAVFTAQIGMLGLLEKPFHATIFERAQS